MLGREPQHLGVSNIRKALPLFRKSRICSSRMSPLMAQYNGKKKSREWLTSLEHPLLNMSVVTANLVQEKICLPQQSLYPKQDKSILALCNCQSYLHFTDFGRNGSTCCISEKLYEGRYITGYSYPNSNFYRGLGLAFFKSNRLDCKNHQKLSY